MKVHFHDPEFAFQFLRVLGGTAERQAEVGECFATAARIVEGDFESWTREWTQTATRVHAIADRCASEGFRASAADAYSRAANYYRAAEFYLHGNPTDPRIEQLSDVSGRCFRDGLRAGEVPHESLDIPYEGTTLPGIFYTAPGDGPRPVVIVQTGFDGTIDGLYPWALAATRRGFHCLTFEGPGQGRVIRKQGLPFRHDWEHVVSAVVDHVSKRSDIQPERITLLGTSFGGYLAPRAAAFEKRIAACIANGGVFDAMGPRIPPGLTREVFAAALRDDPERVNTAVYKAAETNTQIRWSMGNGMYTFQAATPAEWLTKFLQYELSSVVQQITCPMLVVDVEQENSFPGQAKKLYDALTCEKTWLLFTVEEGAEEHCQTASHALSQQRIFDWLEHTLRIEPRR